MTRVFRRAIYMITILQLNFSPNCFASATSRKVSSYIPHNHRKRKDKGKKRYYCFANEIKFKFLATKEEKRTFFFLCIKLSSRVELLQPIFVAFFIEASFVKSLHRNKTGELSYTIFKVYSQ